MNIFITGISGFIGSALHTKLLSQKEDHWVVYGSSRTLENKYIFKVDLSDPASVKSLLSRCDLENVRFDCIIHCANVLANSDNSRSINLFENNIAITKNLLDIAIDHKVINFIHLSTIGVYPNTDGVYDELSITRPSSNAEGLYSLAKLTSENLFDFYLLSLGIIVTNLRLSQVYGKGMREDRIMKIMEAEMFANKKITVWGNGERVSNFVSIDRVLSAIYYFVKSPLPGLFNVGGENISYFKLAEKVISMNQQQKIKIVRLEKGVKSKVYVNSDKLDNLI